MGSFISFISVLDGKSLQIIDKNLPIVQLMIAHRHRLVLFRTGMLMTYFMYHVYMELPW